MARWDPGTEERLTRAALDLFAEHGYDDVTVTQIAERAGITRRSYFRYFPDKREVLFAGSERLPIVIGDAVLAADPAASPLSAVVEAFAQAGAALAEHVGRSAERRAVIASSPELQERERSKFAAVADAIRTALLRRDVDEDRARLVAQIATLAAQSAFERWTDGPGHESFAECLDRVIESVRDVLAGGGGPSR
ncbi:HTH-type transcriptional regulator BetI [Microbacterium hydrocarbonoxydans]|uniref:HTH-type transcriptional regulator BetI n=1 Tax=Microbacterium hydrocarbonoxydans TaxID=273678 RepID=A0A0M2HNF4_9MICO|nr:TetR/AcrR family transcriptional regulator [Microbacterium hydrocarbonoxydans]KJL48272.1 HTH-type transcriptional regulator BetI [Microbacterium hydrocarbonoxydans]